MNFKFWKKKPSLNCDKCKTQLNQYSIDENNIEWIVKKLDYGNNTDKNKDVLRFMLPNNYFLFQCPKCGWIKVIKKEKVKCR